jgi:hypothetical protein
MFYDYLTKADNLLVSHGESTVSGNFAAFIAIETMRTERCQITLSLNSGLQFRIELDAKAAVKHLHKPRWAL